MDFVSVSFCVVKTRVSYLSNTELNSGHVKTPLSLCHGMMYSRQELKSDLIC